MYVFPNYFLLVIVTVIIYVPTVFELFV